MQLSVEDVTIKLYIAVAKKIERLAEKYKIPLMKREILLPQ